MPDWTPADPSPALLSSSDRELVFRMLGVLEKLADHLSPVEIVKALQGPPVVPQPVQVPWGDDVGRPSERAAEDPWGTPEVTLEEVQAAARAGGWADPPFHPTNSPSTNSSTLESLDGPDAG